MVIIFGVIVITNIINGFDFLFLRLAFILAGVTSIIDGIESYLKKDNKWRYILDFGMAILWCVTAFLFWQ